MNRRISLALISFAAVLAAGCSFSIGGTTVDKKTLSDEISKQLTEQLNRAPESVTCPGDLKGEVGQTATCEFTENGDDYSVKVTVTKVEGDQVSFDIEPETPKTIDKDELADKVSDQIKKDAKFTPESVTCPEDVDRKKGTTVRCEYTETGEAHPVMVTVTKIDGIDFEVGVEGIPVVTPEDVAQQVSDQLAQQVGFAPESVTCPGPLEGIVGTEMRCVLIDSGENYGVTVTVTKIEGTNVNFNIKVDDEPS
jgi:hypothetical protein